MGNIKGSRVGGIAEAQINQERVSQENQMAKNMREMEYAVQEERSEQNHQRNEEQTAREQQAALALQQEREQLQNAVNAHQQSEQKLSEQIRNANNLEAELREAATRNEAYQQLKTMGTSSKQPTRGPMGHSQRKGAGPENHCTKRIGGK